MLRYRTKANLILVFLALALTTIILALHMGYLIMGTMKSQRIYMETICQNIQEELSREGVTLETLLDEEVADDLRKKLIFASGRPKVRCLIVNNNGINVFQLGFFQIRKAVANFPDRIPYGEIPMESDDSDHAFFITGAVIFSGNCTIQDIFKMWQVMERFVVPGGAIFVETDCQFEIVTHFLEGIVLAVVASIILVFSCKYFLRKKFFMPLQMVQETLLRVRAGHLDARIKSLETKDELEVLIQQLNATFADLENAFAKSRQFSSDAAHELRTPLTVIRGTLEVSLSKQRTTEEYQEVISEVLNEVASLSQMVETLLIMTRIERGVGVRQSENFSEIVRSSVEWSCKIAEGKEQTIEAEVEDGIWFDALPNLLERLCRNLLVNAMKYSPEKAKVKVVLKRADDNIIFRVIDNGIGIPKEMQDKIFNRFYRVEHSATTTGYGLGLALVKTIVDYHGGSITVDSEVGKGTAFTVVF